MYFDISVTVTARSQYGSKPSNYQVMGSASLGVAEGEAASLGIAGEVLFYLSRIGFVAYSGGIPSLIHESFGSEAYAGAVAGSDGRRYFVSCEDKGGEGHVFVYDTEVNLWHREDDGAWIGTAEKSGLYVLTADGIFFSGDEKRCVLASEEEGAFRSLVEFGDFVEDDPNRKGTSKFQLRVELEAGASLTVEVQFDSSGTWEPVSVLTSPTKKSHYLPIVPRRSDHFRLRLSGTGDWILHSLVRESYSGSEL